MIDIQCGRVVGDKLHKVHQVEALQLIGVRLVRMLDIGVVMVAICGQTLHIILLDLQ